MAHLEPLMQENFIEYASYVIMDRAIPDLRDGLKPVQRRLLATLFDIDDGKLHKVAAVIGDTMKLHPHGDASIKDALVNLANKYPPVQAVDQADDIQGGYFIQTQGNFGNPVTGQSAAQARYIECRLTPLARETLFHRELTEYTASYDGRKQEPVFLPVRLPVLLMLGTEGIAVGMSTKILPHNFVELLEGQIRLLEGKKINILPDFPTGGIVDVSEYDDGLGKVKVRARLEERDDKSVVIREIPFSTTTESLLNSIENAVDKGHLKVAAIRDFTSDQVEIEIQLPRGVYSEEVIPQLFAYTDCEVSITSNIVAIVDEQPQILSVSDVLERLTEQLVELIRAELRFELEKAESRQHWLTLEQIFIENRVYKRIEKAKTAEKVRTEVWDGMADFEELFVRPMVEEDVDRLLRIPIRRISAYDIERVKKEILEILAEIKALKRKLRRIKETTIDYLRELVSQYGQDYPRRTEIKEFEEVDKREIARAHIRLSYDRKTGFFGSQVKGKDYSVTISEFDRLLIISQDGTYRIVGPTDKILVGKVVHFEPFDPEEGLELTVVYRDTKRFAFGKRVHIQKFIRDREYELIKGKAGRIDYLSRDDDPGLVHLSFVPKKHQKIKEAVFDLGDLEPIGVAARGTRLAPKPVARLKPKARPE